MQHCQILVADESQQHVGLLLEALGKAGYRVLIASDGEDVCLKAISDMPALILMDTQLAKLSGLAAAQRLKQFPATRDIPIIFVSSAGRAEDRIAGLQAGGSDYIVKPFYMEELLERIRIHLTLARGETPRPQDSGSASGHT
jgi:DNA-binding response OmpR family regulator